MQTYFKLAPDLALPTLYCTSEHASLLVKWYLGSASNVYSRPLPAELRGADGKGGKQPTDYPCYSHMISAFSRRAVSVLKNFIDASGDLLEMQVNGDIFYIFRPRHRKLLIQEIGVRNWPPADLFTFENAATTLCCTEPVARAIRKQGLIGIEMHSDDSIQQPKSLHGDAEVKPRGRKYLVVQDDDVSSHVIEEMAFCSKEGEKSLNVLGSPELIVTAIYDFIKRSKVEERGPDAQTLTNLGVLLGNQYVEQFGWKWRRLVYDDNTEAFGVVAPNRSMVLLPVPYLKKICSNPDVANNVLLMFNMIASGEDQPPENSYELQW